MPVDRSLDPEAVRTFGLTMKAELRKSMMRTRSMLPRDQRAEWSRAITERVTSLPAWTAARSIALFRTLPARGEIDTAQLDEVSRAAGKRVAYPTIETADDAAIEEATMGFRFVDDPSAMRGRGRGFPEPLPEAPIASELDLIIVPGLAFDPRGYRIGYGAGLYDRTLPRFASAITVGVAFQFQLVLEMPRAPHDVAVSMIVTDKQVLAVGEAGER